MELGEALKNKREEIVSKWVDYTLSTYQSSAFFLKEKDAFANPVGSTIRQALKKLFVLLAENADPKEFLAPLEQIMLIRSVQEFTPSQALAPINAVKHITRAVLAADKQASGLVGDLYDFEFAVDLALLSGFDIYMQCRERLYKVRIREIKTGSHILTDSQCPTALLNNIRNENSETVKSN
ncbi:MAG: RsbRD N-terminal domain-containing protein [Desulfocapsaceae bacterium]|nr:RsbRD N-terminal domain-containing protein [Desulfocapsaceae bacterium]